MTGYENEEAGIIPRFCEDMFTRIHNDSKVCFGTIKSSHWFMYKVSQKRVPTACPIKIYTDLVDPCDKNMT